MDKHKADILAGVEDRHTHAKLVLSVSAFSFCMSQALKSSAHTDRYVRENGSNVEIPLFVWDA